MTINYLKRGKPEAERAQDDTKVRNIVETILGEIESNGDAAVRALSVKFDNYSPDSFKLSEEQIESLVRRLSSQELSDIRFAQEQVRNFARAQRESMRDIEIETIPE
jgi:sulfopropanediol 3-dehydrogenase